MECGCIKNLHSRGRNTVGGFPTKNTGVNPKSADVLDQILIVVAWIGDLAASWWVWFMLHKNQGANPRPPTILTTKILASPGSNRSSRLAGSFHVIVLRLQLGLLQARTTGAHAYARGMVEWLEAGVARVGLF